MTWAIRKKHTFFLMMLLTNLTTWNPLLQRAAYIYFKQWK